MKKSYILLLLVFATIFSYPAISTRPETINKAKVLAIINARSVANEAETFFSQAVLVTRSTDHPFLRYKSMSNDSGRTIFV